MQPDEPSDKMARSAANPHLPRMIEIGDEIAPAASTDIADTGLAASVLADLAPRAAYTVPQFSTQWAVRRLHLPQLLIGEVLEELRRDRLIEHLGDDGPFGFRYGVTHLGRERAKRLFEICGYVGPAPVSLAAYSAMIEWQMARYAAVRPEDVQSAISDLVLSDRASKLAGLAISSGRSLFLFGPPGNGKTSLGRALHGALQGNLWIPHCIGVEDAMIRVFDPQCHEPVDNPAGASWPIDRRWVKIRRPHIVVGGEMTLEAFDLSYSQALRYYEAPLQVKANGGTYLIDDFGRQRVDPLDLLNRWIIPLEHQIDYLSLHSGQKIQIPFRLMLIIATNLEEGTVSDPAFLRRMGYRLNMRAPSWEQYVRIFEQYAARRDAVVAPGVIEQLRDRYRVCGRELRACEPRDLIERVADTCRYRGVPLVVDDELLDLAWTGYFGESTTSDGG